LGNVAKKQPCSTPQTTRQFYFECSGNRLPFRDFANSSPAVSALAQSCKITALKSALAKTKNLKPTAINTYKKIVRRVSHICFAVVAQYPRFRIAFGPDEDSG
jgi:hypothetical protein